MTHNTIDNEHIRSAAQLVEAKARRRVTLLQQRVEEKPELAPEIAELERIGRLASEALQELEPEGNGRLEAGSDNG